MFVYQSCYFCECVRWFITVSVCLWVYLGVTMGVSVGVQEVIGVILIGTLGHALYTVLLLL